MASQVVCQCLWQNCPAPGPYDSARALGEHMDAWHRAADAASAEFRCRWRGCAYEAVGRNAARWARHVRRHSGHRPHACPAAGCAAAFALPHALHRHQRTAHAAGARCLWEGCTAPHARDARALLEHLLAEHRPGLARDARCGWQGCSHVFQRDYPRHVEVHCPDLYTCKTCSRGFRSQTAMKNHARKHSAAAAGQDADSESDAESLESDNAPASSRAANKKRTRDDDGYMPSGKRRRSLTSILDEEEVELAVTTRISPIAVPPVVREGEKEVIVIDDSDDEILPILDRAESETTACDEVRPAFNTTSKGPVEKDISSDERRREDLLRARLLAMTRVPERETGLARRDELCEWGDEDDWEYCT